MSSPNHSISDIEDAFSSNSPNYTPASPDYSPTSPEKNYSSSSNNSFGLVLIASPTLSLFHDDPYMKVMHTYDAIIPPQVPIPPPMLSPIFNPQDSLFMRNYYHLKNKMPPESTSTSAAPAMTQAAIWQLVADRAVAALEAQAANMATADNTNRNHEPREAPIELATLCPTMVPNSEKIMEVFIGGLPQSIEGNVTASKPQTLEEAINIS
nr:reverse transcriptase domain-containing protein [Tanacetum cinerariifolium]